MNWKFEPNDFEQYLLPYRDVIKLSEIPFMHLSQFANDKLQEWLKDAKVVYSFESQKKWYIWDNDHAEKRVKGLLINIEPIEDCKHEASKVHRLFLMGRDQDSMGIYECSCGARVTPSGFEKVK